MLSETHQIACLTWRIGRMKQTIADLKKKRTKEEKIFIEGKLRTMNKPPDYLYSLTGYKIVGDFIRSSTLNRKELEIIICMSYYKYFRFSDLKYWNPYPYTSWNVFKKLIHLDYLLVVEIPSKLPGKKNRKVYVLSPKGKEVEQSYKKYYDTAIGALRNNDYQKDPTFDKAYRALAIKRREHRKLSNGKT